MRSCVWRGTFANKPGTLGGSSHDFGKYARFQTVIDSEFRLSIRRRAWRDLAELGGQHLGNGRFLGWRLRLRWPAISS